MPTWSIAEQFQIRHTFNTQEFIVDIVKRSCSYNFWELVEIPCRHVVAALSYKKQNPDDFVDVCYIREKYALCYGFSVSPINGQKMWLEVQTDKLLLPVYKNGSGRQGKGRIRECGEDGVRRRRLGVAYICTNCDKFGHNALSCKRFTQYPNALKRKPNASQADNNVVADNNIVASHASSCVVDTSHIGLSKIQAKQKKGRNLK
ncbi:hypothetical protein KIW84_024594 [Lathyrus oleraceus]|uniref:SWIM-type domain-containing protein n=1 Tax=Pisum sativum TaxID=3888 RepID=A0A9D4YG10_PEA|nr:hypothetical protein KIW84_024594 [Pisum sativum]